VTTGEYNDALDKKIAEIKQTCHIPAIYLEGSEQRQLDMPPPTAGGLASVRRHGCMGSIFALVSNILLAS
jgi:hypothetical protein